MMVAAYSGENITHVTVEFIFAVIKGHEVSPHNLPSKNDSEKYSSSTQ